MAVCFSFLSRIEKSLPREHCEVTALIAVLHTWSSPLAKGLRASIGYERYVVNIYASTFITYRS